MEIMSSGTIHHGQNIKRFRDILGVKQERIAIGLGISQQAMSKLEQKEQIDDDLLDKISKILNVPVEAIKNFNDEAAINIVANNFNETSSLICHQINPIDRIIELYERLLQTEKEKNALLEQMIAGKN